MEIDKTTLYDLSIFNAEEEFSVFNKLNFTQTDGGREKLRSILGKPLSDVNSIVDIQNTIQVIGKHIQKWPDRISNGTLMVVEKFFETNFDVFSATPSWLSVYLYKILHGPDYSLLKYSTEHCFELIKGMQDLQRMFLNENTPPPLRKVILRAAEIINKPQFQELENFENFDLLSKTQFMELGHFIRFRFKFSMLELVELYYQLDAWYSMATAVSKLNLQYPHVEELTYPTLEADGLFHILLRKPVAYDVHMNKETNFIFLTGANMAGKSTFIKAIGVAVYLSHIGMGVPAKNMHLSLFDGILSNINVVDNIVKGESFFYNEVQRVKNTVLKINNGLKWLVLIDEIFKGTNIQDAMNCSTTVIKGLLKIKNSLFIVSTHLYEIGDTFKNYPNILFKYFETSVQNDQLHFSYHLKDGISNDRLGFLILKKERVVELLEKL